MGIELKLNNRTASVSEIKRNGNIYTVAVDGKIYEIDILKLRNQEYSILSNGKSYNIEVIEDSEPKHYIVNVGNSDFQIEVFDDESRYKNFRSQNNHENGDTVIKSPMPGRVVKVLVNEGDKVEIGQPIIILSAMKMESEYKAGVSGIITEIAVKEGDTVEGNQLLVVIEELI